MVTSYVAAYGTSPTRRLQSCGARPFVSSLLVKTGVIRQVTRVEYECRKRVASGQWKVRMTSTRLSFVLMLVFAAGTLGCTENDKGDRAKQNGDDIKGGGTYG